MRFNLFPIPSYWEITTLSKAIEKDGGNIQTGPFGSQLHARDYTQAGIPVIMPQNITEDRVTEEKISYISNDDALRLERYILQQGDIVYSRRGDIERRAIITEQEDGWFCGTGCLRIRIGSDKIDSYYMYYYLGHSQVKQWIVQHAVGATMLNLNTSILGNVPFVIPPLHEQRAIAHVLGSLDDKIELNRKMNTTLEELARAIFKSWFVDFDPVHAKAAGHQPVGMDAATAALFPDSFETIDGREVPRGWRIVTLGVVVDNLRRNITFNQLGSDTPYIGLEHMPRKSIALDSWDYAENIESNKFKFLRGEILFGKLRPYFRKVGIAPTDGVCSTDILVLSPKKADWFGFILGHVSSAEFIHYTDLFSNGARMPRVNWRDMSNYQVAVPTEQSEQLVPIFNNFVQPFVTNIIESIHESRKLAKLRDSLLPKLLSGEIRVRDAEHWIETVS